MRGDSCNVDFLKFRDIFATLEYHMKKVMSAAMETGHKGGYIRIPGAAAGRPVQVRPPPLPPRFFRVQ